MNVSDNCAVTAYPRPISDRQVIVSISMGLISSLVHYGNIDFLEAVVDGRNIVVRSKKNVFSDPHISAQSISSSDVGVV